MNDASTQPCEVFISYAHSDTQRVLPLYQAVRRVLPGAWMDVDGIHLSDRWLPAIEQALAGCRAYVIVIGAAGLRPWVLTEPRSRSRATSTKACPYCRCSCRERVAEDLPPFLSLFQAKVFGAAPTEEDYDRLARDHEALLR